MPRGLWRLSLCRGPVLLQTACLHLPSRCPVGVHEGPAPEPETPALRRPQRLSTHSSSTMYAFCPLHSHYHRRRAHPSMAPSPAGQKALPAGLHTPGWAGLCPHLRLLAEAPTGSWQPSPHLRTEWLPEATPAPGLGLLRGSQNTALAAGPSHPNPTAAPCHQPVGLLGSVRPTWMITSAT